MLGNAVAGERDEALGRIHLENDALPDFVVRAAPAQTGEIQTELARRPCRRQLQIADMNPAILGKGAGADEQEPGAGGEEAAPQSGLAQLASGGVVGDLIHGESGRVRGLTWPCRNCPVVRQEWHANLSRRCCPAKKKGSGLMPDPLFSLVGPHGLEPSTKGL